MGSGGPPCLPTLIKIILCPGVSFIDVDLSSDNVLYLVLSPGWKTQNNYLLHCCSPKVSLASCSAYPGHKNY